MQDHKTLRLTTSAALLLALAACGGSLSNGNAGGIDTTGAGTAATFALATDVAKAAASVAGLATLQSGPTIGGKSANSKTTTPCDSGSVTDTTDDSTPYPDDGRHEFDNCTFIQRDQNNNETSRLISNGVFVDKCNATASNNTVCTSGTAASGENGLPITLESKSSTADGIIKSLTSGTQTRSGATHTDTASGSQEVDNLVNHKSVGAVFDGLSISVTDNANGTESDSIGGGYGLTDLARSSANCVSGRMTVSTPVALLVNQSTGNITAGRLHFTSASGNNGDVVFNADGSVTASVNGGAASTIPRSQFATFCSVD